MSKRKSIAVAIVLLLILLIGGMMAFFTDTDTATNVFELGEVDITLSEANWNVNNAKNLHPGDVVTKDPVIKNETKSTPAYVFAEIIVPCYDAVADANNEVDTPLFSLNTIGTGWTLISTSEINTTNKTITYVYAYGTSSAMTSLAVGASTPAVFSKVTLSNTLTSAQAEAAGNTHNIVVNAYGIQADNLGTSDPSAVLALFNRDRSTNP